MYVICIYYVLCIFYIYICITCSMHNGHNTTEMIIHRMHRSMALCVVLWFTMFYDMFSFLVFVIKYYFLIDKYVVIFVSFISHR